jgi:hypothetical protein
MNKLLLFVIVLLLINNSDYAQNERIIISNKATIDSLSREITILHNNFDRIKVDVELANKLIDSNNKVVTWSGILGILVTALLFGLGLFSYFSFTSSKKDVNLLIKQAGERLEKAESQFNSFVNSPEKISNLFEDLYFKQIEKEIDSENEKVFIQGLYRANILSETNKESIARRIKEKLYNPDFWMHQYPIYLFLRENYYKKPEELAAEVFYRIKNSLSLDLLFLTAEDLFYGKSKPFLVEPFIFFSHAGHKGIVIGHLRKFLDDESFYSLINCIVKNKDTMSHLSLRADYDKNNITKIFADNIEDIDPIEFKRFIDLLNYDEKIFRFKIKEKPDIKDLHDYVKNNLTDISKINILFSLLDSSLSLTWVEILKLRTSIPEMDKINLLKQKYFEMNTPRDRFFKEVLPLLLEPNYGIIKKGDDYYFNDQKLNIGISYSDTKPDLEVYHPVMERNYSISNIN